MGFAKSRKRNDTRYGLTCSRPQTYAENLLNVGAKQDAQDDLNLLHLT